MLEQFITILFHFVRECLFELSDFFFFLNYLSLVQKIRYSLDYILKRVTSTHLRTTTFVSKEVDVIGREFESTYIYAIVGF